MLLLLSACTWTLTHFHSVVWLLARTGNGTLMGVVSECKQ